MSAADKTPKEVIAKSHEQGIQMVDMRFTDLLGSWQHFSISIRVLTEDLFKDGMGFDGSSIRGFREIHVSDMILKPDAGTAFVDPVLEVPTLAIVCDIYDPITLQPYSRDPRYVARKAEAYLKKTLNRHSKRL